jgi:hypothetical protein
MGNGWPPPRTLTSADYDTIKNGTHIASGTYAGCIRVGRSPNYVYYHVVPNDEEWELKTGAPKPNQCPIPAGVWADCRAGGTYPFNSEGEYWEDDPDQLRWAADAGYDVQLVKL